MSKKVYTGAKLQKRVTIVTAGKAGSLLSFWKTQPGTDIQRQKIARYESLLKTVTSNTE